MGQTNTMVKFNTAARLAGELILTCLIPVVGLGCGAKQPSNSWDHFGGMKKSLHDSGVEVVFKPDRFNAKPGEPLDVAIAFNTTDRSLLPTLAVVKLFQGKVQLDEVTPDVQIQDHVLLTARLKAPMRPGEYSLQIVGLDFFDRSADPSLPADRVKRLASAPLSVSKP